MTQPRAEEVTAISISVELIRKANRLIKAHKAHNDDIIVFDPNRERLRFIKLEDFLTNGKEVAEMHY